MCTRNVRQRYLNAALDCPLPLLLLFRSDIHIFWFDIHLFRFDIHLFRLFLGL